jgi:hypothetical protein
LRSVPGLDGVAKVTSEQVANVGSSDIDEVIWRRLLGRIQAALDDPEVAGVVITHGTDTLEEAAFFLALSFHLQSRLCWWVRCVPAAPFRPTDPTTSSTPSEWRARTKPATGGL